MNDAALTALSRTRRVDGLESDECCLETGPRPVNESAHTPCAACRNLDEIIARGFAALKRIERRPEAGRRVERRS
jgi:hypothetical protein